MDAFQIMASKMANGNAQKDCHPIILIGEYLRKWQKGWESTRSTDKEPLLEKFTNKFIRKHSDATTNGSSILV